MNVICNFTYFLIFTYFHDIVYISIDIFDFIELLIIKKIYFKGEFYYET